jgi:hypothetical protein
MPPPKSIATYNASLFPDFQYGHVLPPKVLHLQSVPEVRACLKSVVYLVSQIDLAERALHLRAESVRATYFRAALAELLRVEDLSKGCGRRVSFGYSDDPLLHIVRLLRHYGVHLGEFTLAAGSIRVMWAQDEAIYKTYIVDNLSLPELRRLNSAKGYSDSQLEELLNLFDQQQRRFGVVQLLYNTVLHVEKLLA